MAASENAIRTQAELVTQLAKAARRSATLVVQAAAQLESMAAETVDLGEDNEDGNDRRSTQD